MKYSCFLTSVVVFRLDQEEHMQVPNGTGPGAQRSSVPCWHATPVADARPDQVGTKIGNGVLLFTELL